MYGHEHHHVGGFGVVIDVTDKCYFLQESGECGGFVFVLGHCLVVCELVYEFTYVFLAVLELFVVILVFKIVIIIYGFYQLIHDIF